MVTDIKIDGNHMDLLSLPVDKICMAINAMRKLNEFKGIPEAYWAQAFESAARILIADGRAMMFRGELVSLVF
jgi:hypothetical protein